MTRSTRPCHGWRRIGAAVLMSGMLAAPADAAGRSVVPPPAPEVLTLEEAAHLLRVQPSDLERLARRHEVPARRIGAAWRFNRKALLAWLNGDWKLIAAVRPPARALGPGAMKRVTGTGTSGAQAQPAPSVGQAGPADGKTDQDEPIGKAPEERTAQDVFLRRQKVLLAPGQVAIDTGFFYSKNDNQQLALAGGGVGLATVQRQTFSSVHQVRVGVLDETELFAGTTLQHQDNEATLGDATLDHTTGDVLGDVHLGVRRTLLHEGPGLPNIIATIDGHIPTGDTSYAVGGGLALVKSVDPVVLFANVNYRHTFSRDFSDVTLLEPKERVDATLGYALALNDTLTLSTAVSGLFTRTTNFTAGTLRGQDSYSMQLALTSWIAKGLYLEPSVSFGLSGPGDSVAFGIAAPYTF